MSEEIIKLVRHILEARIDNASTPEVYVAYCNARDIFEYTLADNYECLKEFDYQQIVTIQDGKEVWM